ncbi:hypothetical protein [Methylobacterium oryzisoli]
MRALVISNWVGRRVRGPTPLVLLPVRLDNLVDVIRIDDGVVHVLDQFRAVRRQWPSQINLELRRCSVGTRSEYIYVFDHVPIRQFLNKLKDYLRKLGAYLDFSIQIDAPQTRPHCRYHLLFFGNIDFKISPATSYFRAETQQPEKYPAARATYAVTTWAGHCRPSRRVERRILGRDPPEAHAAMGEPPSVVGLLFEAYDPAAKTGRHEHHPKQLGMLARCPASPSAPTPCTTRT